MTAFHSFIKYVRKQKKCKSIKFNMRHHTKIKEGKIETLSVSTVVGISKGRLDGNKFIRFLAVRYFNTK